MDDATVNTPVMRENRGGGWVVGWEERTFYSLPSSHMYEGKVRRSGEALAVLSGIDCFKGFSVSIFYMNFLHP